MFARAQQLHIEDIEETLFYKRAVFLCLSLMAVSVAVYAYAIGSTVHFVLLRSAYEKQAGQLSAHLGNLQSQYLAMSEGITLDRGTSLGLHATKDVSFVNRAAPELSFAGGHEL